MKSKLILFRLSLLLIFVLCQLSTQAQSKKFISLEKAMESPENVRTLNLAHNQLNEFPAEIFQLPNLEKLILNNNNIEVLPSGIKDLKKLTHLELAHNQLSEIPEEFMQLENISHLDLSHNAFFEFPVVITKNTSLFYLDLSYNSITIIPYYLRMLDNLSHLLLAHNQIKVVPLSLDDHISHLHIFDLAHNRVRYLPTEVDITFGEEIWETNMGSLEVMDVRKIIGQTEEEVNSFIADNFPDYTFLDESTSERSVRQWTKGLTVIRYNCVLMDNFDFTLGLIFDNKTSLAIRVYYAMNRTFEDPTRILRFAPKVKDFLSEMYGDPYASKTDLEDFGEEDFEIKYYSWKSVLDPDVNLIIYRKGLSSGWSIRCDADYE